MTFAIQSDIIGGMQFMFAAMCLPTLLNPKAQVPRVSSGLTSLGLWMLAITFLTMGPLWVSVIGSMTCASAWLMIFLLRPVVSLRTNKNL